MPVPFVDLQAQFAELRDEILPRVEEVMKSAAFILGGFVEEFERDFAAYVGVKHAVGVASGTDALVLALRALDIGPGDEVILPVNTFMATAMAVSLAGAIPVFVDIDPKIHTIAPALIEERITAKAKVIIPVHLYGHPADMDPIQKIAKKHGLCIVEDACQAHGAEYKGKRIGSLGNPACFSFYPSKNLGAFGDGGMITTDDDALDERIRALRNYGQKVKNRHDVLGMNSRLDSLQAAILRVKLPHLHDWNDARRKAAAQYNKLLAGLDVTTSAEQRWAKHVYHLYVIRTKRRDELQNFLKKKGIDTGIHYPTPIHLQGCYRCLGHGKGDFPVAEECAREILSLPMYPEIPPESVREVADAIREFLS
ncbi:MAG: DegT/DnrJ/EryC1/StrS family aminotransferase [Planctomycetota bacterium]